MKTESTSCLVQPNNNENVTLSQINPKAPEPAVRECRICLSSEEQQKMISPCECTGSLKFVHEGCLKQWFQVRILKQAEEGSGENSTQCQLCKSNIQMSLEMKRECRPRAEFCHKVRNHLPLFIVCIIGMICASGVLVYTTIELITQLRYGYELVEPISKGIVVGSFPVNALLLVFFIYHLTPYFTKKKVTVEIASK